MFVTQQLEIFTLYSLGLISAYGFYHQLVELTLFREKSDALTMRIP
jgi:hypothetical protein